jgi:hypothetical protein
MSEQSTSPDLVELVLRTAAYEESADAERLAKKRG